MKDIRAVKGKFLIERLIAEGEHERQDFKYKISDARKIARSLSAFANHLGGRLLVGVKDNGTVAGVRSEEDIYMIETAAASFCRPEPRVSFRAYKATDEGAVVVVADVEPINGSEEMVCVREEGGEMRAYVRVADENIAAPAIMVRARRRKLRSEGVTLVQGGPEAEIIAAIGTLDRPTPERVLLKAKASRLAAAEAMEKLLAIEAVYLRYRGGEFILEFAD